MLCQCLYSGFVQHGMQAAETSENAASMVSKYGAQAAETSENAGAKEADAAHNAFTSEEPSISHSGTCVANNLSFLRPCRYHSCIIGMCANKLRRTPQCCHAVVRRSLAV